MKTWICTICKEKIKGSEEDLKRHLKDRHSSVVKPEERDEDGWDSMIPSLFVLSMLYDDPHTDTPTPDEPISGGGGEFGGGGASGDYGDGGSSDSGSSDSGGGD